MPTLLAEAVSLVITRSTTSTGNARRDDSCRYWDPDTNTCYGPWTKAYTDEIVGVCVGLLGFFICAILCGFIVRDLRNRNRLRQSLHSTSNYFRPSSEYFIFRRCCSKKIKHGGPLEQDYQPYEMMRPQGHHDAEAGVNNGFGNEAVSEG